MKSAVSTLCVAGICALTALAFKSPTTYRAIAPWVLGIVTFFVLGGLILWGLYCWSGKIIRLSQWTEHEGRVLTILLGWVALTLLMGCLWFLPHVLPQTPSFVVPAK